MRSLTLPLLLALAVLAGCANPAATANDGPEHATPPGDLGTTRQNTVGKYPYDGPTTAAGLMEHCEGGGYDHLDCYAETLKAYLHSAGAKPAFDLLVQVTLADPAANTQSHAIAHVLGNYALKAYGGIETTLRECSYELFQGCLHGAMQAHFERLGELRPEHYVDLCPDEPHEGTDFEQYACVHGLGHGFLLSTDYALDRTLSMCDDLRTWFARSSCHGGAFHENLVGYLDHEHPVEGLDHVHGDTRNATFWIHPDDPYFPCNAVDDEYRETCWLLQTSLILRLNGGDFAAAADVCQQEQSGYGDACFRSLGRDASAYANSACGTRADACYSTDVYVRCSHAPPAGLAVCIKGAVAEVVLNYADPLPGIETCRGMPQDVKSPCYEETGVQAANMRSGSALEQVCSQAEPAHSGDCRRGARLG